MSTTSNPKIPAASSEQLAIVEALANNNVVGEANAGAGKTTCSIHISLRYSDKSILMLTYNNRLAKETKQRFELQKIRNTDVFTYHGFCCAYYKEKCINDSVIREILASNTETLADFAYDMIIIDECQDMTPLLYALVCKITRDNKKIHPIMCVFGDKKQSIYSFNGADSRFITFANKIFDHVNTNPWAACGLETSYRLTDNNGKCVNKGFLGEDRIKTIKTGELTRYLMCNVYGDEPFDEVEYYLNLGYKPDDIFILAPSLRTQNTPAIKLSRLLSADGKYVHVPTDDAPLDDDIMRGKIVFSTYHQAKGLERPVVIVCGVDMSYVKYYNKAANTPVCPNEMYVALTRAKERMSVLHHYEHDYLPFANREMINASCDVRVLTKPKGKPKIVTTEKISREYGVTELLRHLLPDVIQGALRLLAIKKFENTGSQINIPTKTVQGPIMEGVADLTGLAIPAYYELLTQNKMSILEILHSANILPNTATPSPEPTSISKILKIAVHYDSYMSGYNHRIKQIRKYDWVKTKQVAKCIVRLNKLELSKQSEFEARYYARHYPELLGNELTGSIDCISGYNVWEFKCTSALTDENMLQLGLYMYLREKSLLEDGYPPGMTIRYKKKGTKGANRIGKVVQDNGDGTLTIKRKLEDETIEKSDVKVSCYYLYNILTDEKIKISASMEDLERMVELLISSKNRAEQTQSDENFLAGVNKIREKYII